MTDPKAALPPQDQMRAEFEALRDALKMAVETLEFVHHRSGVAQNIPAVSEAIITGRAALSREQAARASVKPQEPRPDDELDSLVQQMRKLVSAYACASMDWDWAKDEAEAWQHIDRKRAILLEIERLFKLHASQPQTPASVKPQEPDDAACRATCNICSDGVNEWPCVKRAALASQPQTPAQSSTEPTFTLRELWLLNGGNPEAADTPGAYDRSTLEAIMRVHTEIADEAAGSPGGEAITDEQIGDVIHQHFGQNIDPADAWEQTHFARAILALASPTTP